MFSGCAIENDFNLMVNKVELNYAGYNDKVTYTTKRKLRLLTNELSNKFYKAESFDNRTRILKNWLAFFRDYHLQISSASTTATSFGKKSKPPELTILDTETVLIRVFSFNLYYKSALDKLLSENQKIILSNKTLIIDLRGNSGGGDSAYSELLPFLYTNPIKTKGVDFWASEDNINLFHKMLAVTEIPTNVKSQIKNLLTQMEKNTNSFVTWLGEIEKFEEVYKNPERVAILIDGKCASAAEQFLLAAKQSKKVILFGSNTRGCLDYSNINFITLPSGKRSIGIPTSRSRRLPENPIDFTGIPPDIKLPEDLENKTDYIRKYIKADN